MTSQKLTQAIALIKAGDKQTAYPLMKELIQEEPQNEQVWLWMYVCVDRLEQKKYCLQKALEINPGNQNARTALDKLIPVPPVASPVKDNGNSKQPVGSTQPRETPLRQVLTPLPRQGSSSQKATHSTQKKNKSNRSALWIGAGAIFSVVCLAVVYFGGSAIYNNFFALTNSGNGGAESPSIFNGGNVNNGGNIQPTDDGMSMGDSGNEVNPFEDVTNNYDEQSGVFILDYGRLIPIPASQVYPSKNAPVTVARDIVFIIKDQNWYEFSLAEYRDGILQNPIPFETVEVQGTGSAYRYEVRGVNDGVYCLVLKTSEGDPNRDLWCFQEGNSLKVAEVIAGQQLDIRVTPVAFVKTISAADANWSNLEFSLALENYSPETMLTDFEDKFTVKSQQGFEYDCYLFNSMPEITPANFRQKVTISSCLVPTQSSGYIVHADLKIKSAKPGMDINDWRGNYWEADQTYSYDVNIEQFKTGLSFPVIDMNAFSGAQSLITVSGHSIDLTDATVTFAPTFGDQEDGSQTMTETVQNNITGDAIQVVLDGVIFMSSGSAQEYSTNLYVDIGASKPVNLIYNVPAQELAGSCIFISNLTLGYGTSTKENVLFPNYYVLCY